MKLRARPYRMTARAADAAATGERILDAAVELFWEAPTDQISLAEVARRAGVAQQTVIRRFGSKPGLINAAWLRESERVRDHRDQAPTGDLAAAVHVLMEHYEMLGDRVVGMLGEEQRVAGIAEIAEQGRALHREWCARVFHDALAQRTGMARTRLLAQITAVCDVYTWKVLRRDTGLSRAETELALIDMLTPLVEAS